MSTTPITTTSTMQLVVFPTTDLDGARSVFSALLGAEPYVDGPYYVGFRLDGLEVGLDPNGAGGPICYWDVDDVDAAVRSLVEAGASIAQEPHDVGRGLQVAQVSDADGNLIGLRQQS